ncbi:MAG: methyltransferase domain-containing protein [Planctomycetota bacterium]|jgi:SAM-dependent methyltransferase
MIEKEIHVHTTLDRTECLDYLFGFFQENESARYYIEMHMDRLLETLKRLEFGRPGDRMLELGAFPPFMSLLVQKHHDFSQHLNCLFEERIPSREYEYTHEALREKHRFNFINFDIEKDPYPFPEGYFDIVGIFEVIEHLRYDPMHVLTESNRILKQHGRIFITTPNVAGFRTMHFLINGFAPFHFTKFSMPIGSSRHYREFTPDELRIMAESAGFEIEELVTLNVWQRNPEGFDYRQIYEKYESFLARHGIPTGMRGDDTFLIARKTGPVRQRYPAALYEG